jgi:predicted nucleotidyltransferase
LNYSASASYIRPSANLTNQLTLINRLSAGPHLELSLLLYLPLKYLVLFQRYHRPVRIAKVRIIPDLFDNNRIKTSMSSVPAGYGSLPDAALQALEELTAREDPAIVGIVLTGSAARGMATEHSDVDVIVVRDEVESAREVSRSSAIDEIPMTLAELETVKAIGSDGAWVRWSFAWVKVLHDSSSGGRVSNAVRRQATLFDQEIRDLLVGRSRLDEFINFTYRALKSHREGRTEAARLDSAESVASMLDVVFALSGRIRPYNKYLVWELNEHPLPGVDWQDGRLLEHVNGLLEGSEAAVRESFLAVERACRAYDQQSGQGVMSEVIDAWGEELHLLHGLGGPQAAG